MFKWKGQSSEEGQGLVEYAMILSLVAVVSIAILFVLGDSVTQVFCKIFTRLDPNTDVPVCAKVSVSCAGSKSGGNIFTQASVSDLKPGDEVDYVEFYVDGIRNNTERVPLYCLKSGDGQCQPFSTAGMGNGAHTVKAVAYTENGASGTCEFTFNAP